jgi:glyoxylase I family protein
MIGEIDHIEIEASDAEAMADFLKQLGYEEHRRTEHHGLSIELTPAEGNGPLFEVHTVTGEEVPGINHIAFGVDDVEAEYEALQDAGVDDLVEPYFVKRTGRTICNFRDPDGRRFQLVDEGDA